MSLTIPTFDHHKHTSDGREERIDWIIAQLKKQPQNGISILQIPNNIAHVTNKIEECCRLLRMSASTRKDWTEQILMELKII